MSMFSLDLFSPSSLQRDTWNQRSKKSYFIDSQGFTLLEMMVVVSIMALTAALSVAGFGDFNNRQRVKQAALTLKNNLRSAQTKASTGRKPSGCTKLSGYQINFPSETQYMISPVCTPEGVLAADTTIILPTSVTFSPVPSSFTYGVLTAGIIDIPAERLITLQGVGSIASTITVSPSGEVTSQGL